MTTIEIRHTSEQLRAIYKAYFTHERKKELTKIPYIGIIIVSLLFVGFGLLFNLHFLLYLGLISIAALIIFLLYFLAKFQKIIQKYYVEIEKNLAANGDEIHFSFDQNEMIYQTVNSTHTFAWNSIKYYEENDGDIYLFSAHRELFDIISASIIGKDAFERFKSILQEKHI